MKRANGTGGVVKRKGNRRRPFEARVSVRGLDDKRKIKVIGYYRKRDDALGALLDYNKSPYDIDARAVTMAELFERWLSSAATQKRMADQTLRNIKSAYDNYCESLYNMPYAAIKAHMMQQCVDSCGGGKADAQARVKNLFYNLDREAIGLDVIKHGYSELIRVSAPVRKERHIFSDIELLRLWDNTDMPWVDTVLILLYSGWRISELLALRADDINLDMGIMRGGLKTKAGKNRVVPIHRLIMPLVRNRLKNSRCRLIENRGAPIRYDTYLFFFKGAMGKLGMLHTIHETRHTFRTWLDRANAPLSCVNRIMGHVCGDVGLQTYTHKAIEELKAAVNLIANEQRLWV